MRVENLMTRPVFVCGPNDFLSAAARLMWDHNVGSVVVQDGDRIVGMLTDRDVCMGAYTTGMPLWAIRVRNSMTPDPVTLREDASIAIAERVMREFGVRRLPIVDKAGRLVGLLSVDDLAREAKREWGHEEIAVTGDEVAETIASVTEAHRADRLLVQKH